MAKVSQCPWLATNGLSRWCMNGRFPCNCESCDCSDKRYVEVYATTDTAGTSYWPNYLKENQNMEETEIKKGTLSESRMIDTRMFFENGRIYTSEYLTVNGSEYMEKVDVTEEVAKAISQYINKERNCMITIMKCEKCGTEMTCTEVIATLPPIHVYTCPNCGHRQEEG